MSSPFSCLDPYNLHPWSPSFILHHLSHTSKSQTVLSDMQRLSYGINFPIFSAPFVSHCSPLSSCSDPSPAVNLPHGVFHYQFITYLSLSLFLLSFVLSLPDCHSLVVACFKVFVNCNLIQVWQIMPA